MKPPPSPRRQGGESAPRPPAEPTEKKQVRVRPRQIKQPRAAESGPLKPAEAQEASTSAVTDPASAPEGADSPEPADEGKVRAPRVLGAAQVEQRRKEKRWAGIHLRARTTLKWLLAGATIGIFVWMLFFSSLFAVREGDLRVTTQSGAEEVDQSAALKRLSSEVGTPLLLVRTGAVSADLEENPEIAEARVKRLWPHGLGAELVPRVPAVALETSSGYRLVAKDGVVVRSQKTKPSKLPVMELVGAGDPDPTPAQIEEVLEVRKALPKKVRKRVQRVVLQGTMLSLQMKNGVSVIWGDTSDTELKAQVLGLLMAEQKAKVYDVSTPSRPSTR